jgi:hypothetical protein
MRKMLLWIGRGLLRSAVASEILGQFGVLLERPAGADRTLQDDARLHHGRRHDVRIPALLRSALVEQIAIRASGFQGGLH